MEMEYIKQSLLKQIQLKDKRFMSIKEIISDSKYYYVVYDTYFGSDLFEYINVNVAMEEKQLSGLF